MEPNIKIKEAFPDYIGILNDIFAVYTSLTNLTVHSGVFISKFMKYMANERDYSCVKEDSRTCVESSTSSQSSSNQDSQDNAKSESDIEENLNEIKNFRFTSSGPIFQISMSIINKIEGSYIYEQVKENVKTQDGTLYLDFPGNDGAVYYVLDYINNKKLDLDSLIYIEQESILELFEFCGLPLPAELVLCRYRRDCKYKSYEEGDDVSLYVNNKLDPILKEYLIKKDLWTSYIYHYKNGIIDYDGKTNILSINKNYIFDNYIHQYIKNGTINIDNALLYFMNRNLFEREMKEIFGQQAIEITQNVFQLKTVFINSKIINKNMDFQLQKWLGQNKKWKLLFRASDHDYKASEFHFYCDNKGETITLIKHIGHNNKINIFGGYTDQSWDSSETKKIYSKEVIFTLQNEYNTSPSFFFHNMYGDGIFCSSKVGPVFGSGCDIYIDDNCHSSTSLNYTNALSFYWQNTPQKNSLFVNTDSANSKNYFIVDDYEVWGRL
ncbi:hypothetical protein WA158_000037 [Blastocystis sp. Blastoise]